MKYFLITVLVSSFLIKINEACYCSKQHPQEVYCDADYAVKVLTYSKRLIEFSLDGNHTYLENIEEGRYNVHLEYEVRIMKTYKGKISDHIKDKIYTPYSGSMCGIRLEMGRYYFLIGRFNLDGYMSIGMCDFNMDITHHHYLTSKIISENFLRNWNKGCNKCQFCRDKPKKCSKYNTCIWNSRTSNLRSTLSYCSPSIDESGTCNLWAYDTKLLKKGGRRKFNKIY